ncbi:MAG: DUF4160 domain-containing protein [Chitinophagaceae bacterium]|nr:DUF4160 domain-containing protein [Chitinophagaceae bacterium]
MPVVSSFYGIVIFFFFDHHNPPHFHAKYGEFEALIDIQTFGIIRGYLPSKAHSLVVEWAALHKEELVKDWELAKANKQPEKIEPLK